MLTRYVLGIATTDDSVVLVRKNRPDWQKGKCNFIGGKAEPKEGIYAAMVREFEEETSRKTVEGNWSHFATLSSTLSNNPYKVFVFETRLDSMAGIITNTDEEIVIVPHQALTGWLRNEIVSPGLILWSFLNSSDFLDLGAILTIDYDG